jgi:hypothetical protein
VSELRRIIGEAVGEASLQWDPKPTGVFDSDGAVGVIDRTVHAIDQRIQELEAQAAAMREDVKAVRDGAFGPLPLAVMARLNEILIATDAGKALLERLETEHRDGYDAGAENGQTAMRERAAKAIEDCDPGASTATLAHVIRALPLEET